MLRMPEFKQLLIGISTSLAFATKRNGRFGPFFRKREEPGAGPPPIMIARQRLTGRIMGSSLICGNCILPTLSEFVTIQKNLCAASLVTSVEQMQFPWCHDGLRRLDTAAMIQQASPL
jgi:hypothetical protein